MNASSRRQVLSHAEDALLDVLNLFYDADEDGRVGYRGALVSVGEEAYRREDYSALEATRDILLRLIGQAHQDAVALGETA